MFLYLLTNSANDKYYVGKTTTQSLKKYLSDKRWKARNGNPSRMPVVSAIAKYGWEVFTVDVLAEVQDAKQLDDLERLWIILLDSRNPELGYNVQAGGGTGNLGRAFSEEHKAKIGAANKGRKPAGYIRTPEHSRQLSERMKGNTVGEKFTTESAIKAISEMTPEQRKERSLLMHEAKRKKKEASNFTPR